MFLSAGSLTVETNLFQELTRGKEAQQRTIEALKADMRNAEQKHQEEKAEIENSWRSKLEQAQVINA